MNIKKYTVWFHYNKPASIKAGKTQLTVHFKGVCHIASNVISRIELKGCERRSQPRFVLKGKSTGIEVDGNGVITIS